MSKNNGYTFPWEPMAQRGEEMPEGLGCADQVLYILMRSLYGQVRCGIITRDVAVREKRRLIRTYQTYQLQDQLCKKFSGLIKETELARAAFRKDPTQENGWKLLLAVEGDVG